MGDVGCGPATDSQRDLGRKETQARTGFCSELYNLGQAPSCPIASVTSSVKRESSPYLTSGCKDRDCAHKNDVRDLEELSAQ